MERKTPNLEMIKVLLGNKVKLSKSDYEKLFTDAAKNGSFDIVELLLKVPDFNPSVKDNFVLRKAIEKNNLYMVDVLLEDPRFYIHNNKEYDEYIKLADKYGFTEIKEFLIKYRGTVRVIKK